MNDALRELIKRETAATNEELAKRHPGFSVGDTVISDDLTVWYRCIVHDGTGKNHRTFGTGVKLTGDEIDELLVAQMFRDARTSELR